MYIYILCIYYISILITDYVYILCIYYISILITDCVQVYVELVFLFLIMHNNYICINNKQYTDTYL